MKKRLITALLIGALCLLPYGCGDESSDPAPKSHNDPTSAAVLPGSPLEILVIVCTLAQTSAIEQGREVTWSCQDLIDELIATEEI